MKNKEQETKAGIPVEQRPGPRPWDVDDKPDLSPLLDASEATDESLSMIAFLQEVLSKMAPGESTGWSSAATEGQFYILGDIAKRAEQTQKAIEAFVDRHRENSKPRIVA